MAGMPSVSYTVTGTGNSTVINLDYFTNPFNVGVGCTVSATATYSVQLTLDDVASDTFNPATANWFTDPNFSSATASKLAAITTPARGLRLNVSASTGSVTIQVQQAGLR